MTAASATFLFADLVNVAELLQRAGDPRTQGRLQAHHRLLKRFVAAHGGQPPRWMGDGFLAVFDSLNEAVRCAVGVTLADRRRAPSARLGLRVGLHRGDAPREEIDYFGTSVVIARQLCGAARAGQVLCSTTARAPLVDMHGLVVRECGTLTLPDISAPVPAFEIRHDQPLTLLTHTSFVGRGAELARLTARLQDVRGGSGGMVMLAGEPGIGKTRTLEEFGEIARTEGAVVLWGRCHESEATRPYGPFVEALTEHIRTAPPDELQADLGVGAAPLARLVPVIRQRLSDVAEAVALQPDEERVRLLDTITQFLIALGTRAPVVLVVDDLHWADSASVVLLRHLAGFAARQRLLILGGYREVEVARQQPFSTALGTLPRETTYEHLALTGLDSADVDELLSALAEQHAPDALVTAITAETSGNPFFIREVLLHLVEEGKIVLRGGEWPPNLTFEGMGIPHGVRQVITRRLARLSATTNQLLHAAAGFSGSFRFDIAGRVAGLEEEAALGAIDEALAAQLLVAASDADTFDFTHALVRHTLYGELSPPRQARLHRQIAQEMEHVYGGHADTHAGEIARHYRRSMSFPGAERGVAHCVVAPACAERNAAPAVAAEYLRMALDLAAPGDARRPGWLARLTLALTWSLALDEAEQTATQAAAAVAAAESDAAAAEFLADAADAMWTVAAIPRAWSIATHGLRYLGERRDTTWARLMVHDFQRRDFSDPAFPGLPLNSPEQSQVTARLWELSAFRHPMQQMWAYLGFRSREDVLARAGSDPLALFAWAGEYRRALPLVEQAVATALERGQLVLAAYYLMLSARICAGAGNWAPSMQAYARAREIYQRVGKPPFLLLHMSAVGGVYVSVTGEGWEGALAQTEAMLKTGATENRWATAALQASAAVSAARVGRTADSLRWVAATLPAIEQAPGSAPAYPQVLGNVVTALEELGRTDHLGILESNLRRKWLHPDFRYEMCDARFSGAMLCGLQGRYEEAIELFAQARAVLEEQGAAPMRALVDLYEARMYARRAEAADPERAATLLKAALARFDELGMTGWARRVDAMLCSLNAADTTDQTGEVLGYPPAHRPPAAATLEARSPGSSRSAIFRQEGDYWTFTYDGATGRLKDVRGLHYLSHLLRHPSHEVHVIDLVYLEGRSVPGERFMSMPGDAGSLLDAQAKAEYRGRLVELRAELDEAEQFNDNGRSERIRAEIDAISRQLTAAIGLGGRDRMAASTIERARSTVTQRIKTAIKRIATHSPALADHLSSRIKTGRFCVYRPDPARPIEWKLDPEGILGEDAKGGT